MLDQEQIEAPQFSESPQQTLRLERAEHPVPRTVFVMSPLAFGAAMISTLGNARRRG